MRDRIRVVLGAAVMAFGAAVFYAGARATPPAFSLVLIAQGVLLVVVGAVLVVGIASLARAERARDEIEQLRTQLAGVSTAAMGWSSKPGQEAKRGDYGWSVAYADVLRLRRNFETLLATWEAAEHRCWSIEQTFVRRGAADMNEYHRGAGDGAAAVAAEVRSTRDAFATFLAGGSADRVPGSVVSEGDAPDAPGMAEDFAALDALRLGAELRRREWLDAHPTRHGVVTIPPGLDPLAAFRVYALCKICCRSVIADVAPYDSGPDMVERRLQQVLAKIHGPTACPHGSVRRDLPAKP